MGCLGRTWKLLSTWERKRDEIEREWRGVFLAFGLLVCQVSFVYFKTGENMRVWNGRGCRTQKKKVLQWYQKNQFNEYQKKGLQWYQKNKQTLIQNLRFIDFTCSRSSSASKKSQISAYEPMENLKMKFCCRSSPSVTGGSGNRRFLVKISGYFWGAAVLDFLWLR